MDGVRVSQAEALTVERRHADDHDLVEAGGVVAVGVEQGAGAEEQGKPPERPWNSAAPVSGASMSGCMQEPFW